ncbi:MAG: GNAT family N-acetyltransferase [bacterium]|nr:GNAT family N-acetyltransferase [bacterium]MBU1918663.1 GNAT family N-acetyltransferase [bacterium]
MSDNARNRSDRITIKTLADVDFSDLKCCWCEAFSDYDVPLQASEEELKIRLAQDSYSPQLSVGAFDSDRLIGFWLTGLRTTNAELVGYDAGTAVIPEFRGRGVSNLLSEYLDKLLLREGVSKYILEVFCENNVALSLYRKKGFKVVDKVDTFRTEPYPCIDIENISEFSISECTLDEVYANHANLLDFTPTWQNSWEALHAVQSSTISIVIKDGEEIVGYAIYQPVLRRIAQIGIAPHADQQKIMRQIINYFRSKSPIQDKLEMVNVQPKSSIPALLKQHGIDCFISLYVMERRIEKAFFHEN